MAIAKKNALIEALSGSVGNVILKQYIYGLVISKRPDRSKVKLSAAQKKANTKFKKAVAYAQSVLKDPSLQKIYKKKLTKGQSVYHAALSDYIKTNNA